VRSCLTKESIVSRADFQFCLNFLTDEPLASIAEWWRAAEEGGVDFVGVADSPMILHETFSTAAYGLTSTSRVGFMTAVTNPVSRDPSVMAAGLRSLDSIADGRKVACGIGTGDSAMWTVGLKPARVARMGEYVTAVRALLRGEEASFEGRRFQPAWKHFTPPANVPLYVACAGPRVLRLAAQVADGMIIFMGFSSEMIAFVKQTIADACAEVGRDPAELEVWWQTTINFAPTVEEAMERSLGVNTSWMTMGSLEGKGIPPELAERLVRFNEDMESIAATYVEADRGKLLVERAKKLGLHEWLVSMAPGFWGPPETIAARLAEFREQGMTNWQFYVAHIHGDRLEYVDRFVNGVLPALDRAPTG
jgi:5,10-methylenetetrahydromethanopterin reductase